MSKARSGEQRKIISVQKKGLQRRQRGFEERGRES
jgi:hypothetical protein